MKLMLMMVFAMAAVAAHAHGQDDVAVIAQPVLVELFTSEGCSSCPAADAVLAELAAGQPAKDAVIVPLALHVDYWDRLGWRDPFSSAKFSRRQDAYAKAMALPNTYTPQMVVDGATELIGSDRAGAVRAIEAAAALPKGQIKIDATKGDGNRWNVKLTISGIPQAAGELAGEVMLALTEDGLHSDVLRGENAGKALDHVAVVRLLQPVGQVGPGQSTDSITTSIEIPPTWQRKALRLVAFAQGTENLRMLAIGMVQMPDDPSDK